MACTVMVLTVRVGTSVTAAGTDALPGYEFYERAKWGALLPLISRQAEVTALLGEQTGFVDSGDGWKFGVAIWGGPASCNGHPFPAQLVGTVSRIVLVPTVRVSFVGVKFPAAFTKYRQYGSFDAVGSWNMYRDDYGLEYAVYKKASRDGSVHAGDLKSISYGPSKQLLLKLTECSMLVIP